MPEIAESRTKLQEMKKTYEPLRTKLLAADPKWVDADRDLKEKKKALDDLKHQFAEANAAANKAKAAAESGGGAAAAAQHAASSELPKRGNGCRLRPTATVRVAPSGRRMHERITPRGTSRSTAAFPKAGPRSRESPWRR